MGSLTVALDATITPVLLEEGIARELVNRIQNLRKDKNFEVTDKINIKLQSNDDINLAVHNNLLYICSETLSQSFEIVKSIDQPGKDAIELTDTITIEILLQKVNKNNPS
jgi:isoleucyl-tRNA synthetase